MSYQVFPSGSLHGWKIDVPTWAQPTKWLPIEVGCLAKVLPTGGPIWMNELVVILKEIDVGNLSKPMYLVAGKRGQTILPYYSLDIQGYPSGSLNKI